MSFHKLHWFINSVTFHKGHRLQWDFVTAQQISQFIGSQLSADTWQVVKSSLVSSSQKASTSTSTSVPGTSTSTSTWHASTNTSNSTQKLYISTDQVPVPVPCTTRLVKRKHTCMLSSSLHVIWFVWGLWNHLLNTVQRCSYKDGLLEFYAVIKVTVLPFIIYHAKKI